MLGTKLQWCPRCNRHVQTEQRRAYIGRQKTLVRLIITCFKCRTTLTSRTTRADSTEKEESA